MNILCLQHVPYETPGAILEWVKTHNHQIRVISPSGKQWLLPSHSSYDLLIILGGPMSVNDMEAHPWLKDEKQFLRTAIDSGKKVLGICLGAQLTAAALGAVVSPNPVKEIGWFPVKLIAENARLPFLPKELNTFHWHGETFDIPANADHLYSSEYCLNQGFIYQDRVVALQFHPEVMAENVLLLAENCEDEISNPSPSVQSVEQLIQNDAIHEANRRFLFQLLDRLAEISV